MTKSNGIASLKQAAKLLNKHAPDGESLAYINPEEGRLLKAHGGSGIMTLQGVPSYIRLFGKEIPFTSWLPWETGTDVLKAINPYKAPTDADDNPIYNPKTGEQIRGRSIVGDALSVWGALRAKKEQEGLNAAEMEQFNKLNQQLAMSDVEFKSFSDEGKQLTAPEYVTTPKAVARDIDFSGETTPELITTPIATPAEGGRIGYQEAGSVLSAQQIAQIKQMAAMGSDIPTISSITEATIDQINNVLNPPVESQAQGGRIGYNLGGIDTPFQGIGALNPRMGYAFGEEVEQVTEEVTPFSKIPEHIKKADLDDIPDWWLTDFEQLLEDFKADNNGQNPTSINQLEKWYRFKHGTSQVGPNIEEMLNIGVTDENTNPQEVEQLLGSMQAAQGGRIGAQGGGIMPLLNMGGMEKDYRQDGGFVPIGRKEKADDVPARLSKNEFVFTADAVRAAGGGDIDEGAQRMYNVMKNLEAGGEISQQSQGQG